MKKRAWILVALLLLATTVAVFAADPGSEGDPLISKSYLEGPFADWVRELINDNKSEPAVFTVQSFKKGEKITFEAGTELILRMGKASVVATEKGGLADVTDGYDLQHGAAFPSNHLLIVPVGDGRGLLAEEDILIMVKGVVLK